MAGGRLAGTGGEEIRESNARNGGAHHHQQRWSYDRTRPPQERLYVIRVLIVLVMPGAGL